MIFIACLFTLVMSYVIFNTSITDEQRDKLMKTETPEETNEVLESFPKKLQVLFTLMSLSSILGILSLIYEIFVMVFKLF